MTRDAISRVILERAEKALKVPDKNATVLAYGEKGTGKSMMLGTLPCQLECDDASVLEILINKAFDEIETMETGRLRVKCTEIFVDQLYDLTNEAPIPDLKSAISHEISEFE